MEIYLGDIERKLQDFFASLPCHVQAPYPSAHIPVKNRKIANALLSAFADGGNAELTAITQYFYHALTVEEKEPSELFTCTALVEMHHLDLIGTMIESLGGNPKYQRPNDFYWTGGYVGYGETLCDKLINDILSEQEALAGYESLLRVIEQENDPSLRQVEEVILRIMEDERLHLALFMKSYEMNCVSTGNC